MRWKIATAWRKYRHDMAKTHGASTASAGYLRRLMDFLALDFETATTAADSPCELGIAIVRGGVVREVRNWLIKPPQWPHFSPWNVAVHGIRPDDVAGAPRWEEIWEEVHALLLGATVVAHNAAFDMGVLRATLASHGLPHPSFQYFC
jgi:DNA polymerase-3 subunit epsilon